MPARRALAVVLSWAVVLGVARVAVALPEHCPEVTVGEARAAARETVDWFHRNQRADGRWVYSYDRDADQVHLRTHVVRHSGVTLSLYQAHAAGIEAALDPADRGVRWSLRQAVRHDGWLAIRSGDEVRTGGTALLLAGLVERRKATQDDRFDDDMAGLARYLVAMTEPSGAVLALWDVPGQRPVPGVYSAYFTGEAFLALALYAEVDPDGPWEATARRIGRYLATRRDDVEDRFPPVSDHWAAYGLAQLDHLAGADGGEDGAGSDEEPLGPDGRAYARRQAGLFGTQVRFESQRTGSGLNAAVLRGHRIGGSALGTLGEGLGSLWLLPRSVLPAGDHRLVAERVRCVAGMLVDRQVDEHEAAADTGADPELTRGAWFSRDATRLDDQQHALSALLLARPVLDRSTGSGGGGSSSDDDLGRIVWLVLVAFAVGAPGRTRRALPAATPRTLLLPGLAVTATALAALALVAGPLLRALSISPSTALVATGVVVLATTVADLLVRPPVDDTAPPRSATVLALALRPTAALLVLTVAADVNAPAALAAALAVVAASLVPDASNPYARPALLATTAALTTLGALSLVHTGVLTI